MNKERRARIEAVQKDLADGKLPDIEELRSIGSDEQEAFDNLSENLQTGEKGQRMQEIAEALERVADEFEQARDELESVLTDALS